MCQLEAIQKIEPPTTAKQCKSFAGMVNFVSIFCPELQKLWKPIYDLTRKGKQFVWGVEQQSMFKEIKQRLQKPPVLHMPDKVGRFQLYSDTSKYATGSALYQIQNGKPKLIAYASKRLPEAAHNYSITELEMCGLAINIASFVCLLKKVDFDAVVDHLAITHIIINDRFFIPNLMHYLRLYIKGCHIFQLNRKDKPPVRQLQTRINLNHRPLSRLSMDLKVMLRSCRGHRYILCLIDEVTNYMITAPIKHSRSEEVGEVLINNVISKYCLPDYMIMDLDSAFISLLMNYLFKRLGIKIKTVAPYNHQSLQAEHSIKSL